jgi:hypothetical protein
MKASKAKTKKTSGREKPASPSGPVEKSGDNGELGEEALERVVGGTTSLQRACCTGTHLKEATIIP